GSVCAQDWYGAFTYQMSFPYGDTKEYTNSMSWRGVGMDFRYLADKNTSVGLMFGWNVFYDRVSGSQDLKIANTPGTITGTQDRIINSFPIMLSLHQYFGKRREVRPYIGINGGGFVFKRYLGMGIGVAEDTRWDWGVAPEFGFVIPLQGNSALLLNGRW